MKHLHLLSIASLWALYATGCEAPGVGDPCIPETIPPGGFNDQESFIETSSVQCRTRVCLVYELKGDPTMILGENCPPSAPPGLCPMREEVEERVYCTCRCKAPEGSTATTCDCPEGYSCEELVTVGLAGGARGHYCVKRSSIR
ncbi:MAG: hypothetical protein NZ898_03995 [Myxococcota bacterium]|nr:hypothetical protein [Myxococcota bacterium]MDW8360892.1 hypothetical protein [Myxococcales bacterium]